MQQKDVRNPHFGLYVIWDRISEEAGVPMMFRTDGLAVRAYHQAKVEYKEDMTLYKICEFDPLTMRVFPFEMPKRIPIDLSVEVET